MQDCGMHSKVLRILERRVSKVKKRSGFRVMLRLIGLVKPLTGYMILAITMFLTMIMNMHKKSNLILWTIVM